MTKKKDAPTDISDEDLDNVEGGAGFHRLASKEVAGLGNHRINRGFSIGGINHGGGPVEEEPPIPPRALRDLKKR